MSRDLDLLKATVLHPRSFRGVTLGAALLLLCLGCATPTHNQAFERRDNNVTSSMLPPGQRVVFYKHDLDNDAVQFCAEPLADVSESGSDGVQLSASGSPAFSETLDFSESITEQGLGGRTASVLIVREMLFRACELAMNTDADPKLSLEIFERFLSSIESLSNTPAMGASGVVLSSEEVLELLGAEDLDI